MPNETLPQPRARVDSDCCYMLTLRGKREHDSSCVMTRILLTTLNARYTHAAFGLRYLLANMGELEPTTTLREFTIHERPADIVESILAYEPQIVGIGIYIWNVAPATRVVQLLKAIRPDIAVVLGGPEVSYEWEEQTICHAADWVIAGEADLAFAQLCRQIRDGNPPAEKVLRPPPPRIESLSLPYHLYTDEDVSQRVVYVEASRGCPYTCEFCLSSLDQKVRQVPLPRFFAAMEALIERGVKHFKFIDRTFNLSLKTSRAVLEFFWERYQSGMFLHFEMIPDRLPSGLREIIARFPPGALQFEVGLQTFNPEVAARIARRHDVDKTRANFAFLRQSTGVHIHADLIAGLPGETLESFAEGFDQLVALAPDEIQLGILKRLRGTPISRHTNTFSMVYSPEAPFEILQNDRLGFATIQKLKRMARYWDLVVNSGRFLRTARLLWQDASAFWCFWAFSEWLYATTSQTHRIAVYRLAELIFTYLTEVRRPGVPPLRAARALAEDLQSSDPRALPRPVRDVLPAAERQALTRVKSPEQLPSDIRQLPPRQRRHVQRRNADAPASLP